MTTGRNTRFWPLFGEFLAALAAFALLALSFGQVTPANSVMSSAQFAAIGDLGFCGDPVDPDAAHAGACHACRPDLAGLPPAPCEADPAFGSLIAPLRPADLRDPSADSSLHFLSRAPPVSA